MVEDKDQFLQNKIGDNMYNILIIEDDLKLREELSKFLESSGYHINAITSFNDVLNEMKSFNSDLILLDINLPGSNE